MFEKITRESANKFIQSLFETREMTIEANKNLVFHTEFKKLTLRQKLFALTYIPLIFLLMLILASKLFINLVLPYIISNRNSGKNSTALEITAGQWNALYNHLILYLFFLHMAVFIFLIVVFPLWNNKIFSPYMLKKIFDHKPKSKDKDNLYEFPVYIKDPKAILGGLILASIIFCMSLFISLLVPPPAILFQTGYSFVFYVLFGPSLDIILLLFLWLQISQLLRVLTRIIELQVDKQENLVSIRGRSLSYPFFWHTQLSYQEIHGIGLKLFPLPNLLGKMSLGGLLYLIPKKESLEKNVYSNHKLHLFSGPLFTTLLTIKPILEFTNWNLKLLSFKRLKPLQTDITPFVIDLAIDSSTIFKINIKKYAII
ncbi:MAG: hypothetical protein ACXADY_14495 [Candidatus Hodarchaeales archaeon]|jgi:hypothetical protein